MKYKVHFYTGAVTLTLARHVPFANLPIFEGWQLSIDGKPQLRCEGAVECEAHGLFTNGNVTTTLWSSVDCTVQINVAGVKDHRDFATIRNMAVDLFKQYLPNFKVKAAIVSVSSSIIETHVGTVLDLAKLAKTLRKAHARLAFERKNKWNDEPFRIETNKARVPVKLSFRRIGGLTMRICATGECRSAL